MGDYLSVYQQLLHESRRDQAFAERLLHAMGRDGVEYEEVAFLAVLRCLLAVVGVLLVSKMVRRMCLRVQTFGRE